MPPHRRSSGAVCVLGAIGAALVPGGLAFAQVPTVHYQFDANVLDASGNGYHGQLVGSPAFVVNACGTSLQFDNPVGFGLATQYVLVPDLSFAGAGSFTILLRMRSTDTSRQNGRLFGNYGQIPGVIFNYNRGDSPNALISVNYNGGAGLPFFFDNSVGVEGYVTDGECHWMAVVVDRTAGSVRAYIDSTVQERSATTLGAVALSGLRIGGSNDPVSTGASFAARLTSVEDFRFYTSALADCQVMAVMGRPSAPSILGQTFSSPACSGDSARFVVVIDRLGPFTFQWQIETAPGVWQSLVGGPVTLPCGGAASATGASTSSVSIAVQGCPGPFRVRCVVSNACGSVTSEPATLTYRPGGYANCDGSTFAPVLNAGDFTCFLSRFRAAGSLSAAQQIADYANCDGSTLSPVLNAGDFTCFLARFQSGCP